MSCAELIVESCGPLTTLQDRGRPGWRRIGLAASGALDDAALCAANALVGNQPCTAGIELLAYGARFIAAGGPLRLALAGADFPLTIDGQRIPSHTSVVLEEGARLAIGHARNGVCAILAIEGGVAVPSMLGSRSLHVRARVGGYHGEPLRAGDRIPAVRTAALRGELTIDPIALDTSAPIRILRGPQADHFSATALACFHTATFLVSAQSDRMGYRLTGPRIHAARGHNIISDGVVPGAIQIPGSGHPIAMLADHQTTGGYPKIAIIASPDLRRIAQRRSGEPVRFEAISIEMAQDLLRAHFRTLRETSHRVRPHTRTTGWIDNLSHVNLAGAAVSAQDPFSWA